MRIKVELHREVRWFLKRECTAEECAAFYEQLESICSDPISLIANSEPVHDPGASRYMMRAFRFADNLAVFQMNRSRDRILIRQCQRVARQRHPTQESDNGP